jgi:hypothetical protein
MRKLFKKPLVYLIMTMLALPTWLVTGILNAPHAAAYYLNPGDRGSVVINELAWAGSIAHGEFDEWVELRNMTDTDIDFAANNWYLQKNGMIMTKIDSGVLPANGYFVVSNFNAANSVIKNEVDLVKSSVSLNNTDAQYVLCDQSNLSVTCKISVDTVDDGIGEPYSGTNKPGIRATMERNLIPGDGTDPANWHTSLGRYNLDDGANKDFGTPGFENDNLAPVAGIVKDGMAEDINSTKATDELSANWSGFSDKNADHYSYAVQRESDDYYWDGITSSWQIDPKWDATPDGTVNTVVLSGLSLSEGETYHFVVKLVDKVGLESAAVISDGQTVDTEKPVLTLIGESEVTVELNSAYTDLGVTAVDNYDGDLTSNVIVANAVDTSAIGDYAVIYNVQDSAGNNADQITRTVHVVMPTLVAPSITVTKIEQDGNKSIKVGWQGVGNGATKYEIYVNGVTSTENTINVSVSNDASVEYSKEIKVLNTGSYNIYVKVYRGTENVQSDTGTVEFVAPANIPTVEPVKASNPVSVAPQKAEAATSSEESTVTTPSGDDNGQIKGDEESATDEEEKINWTPWIVLFVLIILAGAATGGYFYWFSGEDEIKKTAPVAVKKTTEKAQVTVTQKPAPKKKNKKSKRW